MAELTNPGSPDVHAVPRSTRIDEMAGAVLLTTIAVFFAWSFALGHGAGAASAMIGALTLLLAALAALYLFKAFRGNRTVTVVEDGLRVGAAARTIAWEEIASARERRLLQRIDLLGADGDTLASIDYAIRDAEEVLLLVQERRPSDPGTPRTVFGRRRPVSYVVAVVLMFLVFGGLAFLVYDYRLGLVLLAVLTYAVYRDTHDMVRETELTDEHLILRGFFGERAIERSRIDVATLYLRGRRGNRSLNIGVVLDMGEVVWAAPWDGNAFGIHRAIVAWLERGDALRAAPVPSPPAAP